MSLFAVSRSADHISDHISGIEDVETRPTCGFDLCGCHSGSCMAQHIRAHVSCIVGIAHDKESPAFFEDLLMWSSAFQKASRYRLLKTAWQNLGPTQAMRIFGVTISTLGCVLAFVPKVEPAPTVCEVAFRVGTTFPDPTTYYDPTPPNALRVGVDDTILQPQQDEEILGGELAFKAYSRRYPRRKCRHSDYRYYLRYYEGGSHT